MGNTERYNIIILFKLNKFIHVDLLLNIDEQCLGENIAPVNMKPHYPPPGRPGGKPGDLKTSLSNTSMQGPNSVSNPPLPRLPSK